MQIKKKNSDSFLYSVYYKSYHYFVDIHMSDNNKLLLRSKDYELQTIKSYVHPNISVHDPLINPPKRKNAKKKITLNQFNPLSRMSKISPQTVAQASKVQPVQQ